MFCISRGGSETTNIELQPIELQPIELQPIGQTSKIQPAAPGVTLDGQVEDGQAREFRYPEGGWLAWMQVFAGFLINSLAWGYPSSYGVYQLYYTETMNLPSSQISWIGSIQVFLAFFICAGSGRLADAGYSRSAVAVGSGFAVVGTLLTSWCTEFWQILLAQGICTGLGLGIMFMPGIAVVSSYFKKRRALALAITATGTGVGSVIFPATVQYLIPQVGFPWAVRCQSLVALVIAIMSTVIIKPRLPARKKGPLFEWGAFKEPPYVFFTLGAFGFFWALYFGFFYINAFSRNVIGLSSQEAVALLLVVNAMSVPGRVIAGMIANRIGPVNTFIMTSVMLSVVIFSWIAVKDRMGLYVFSVFLGATSGLAQGVFVGALASLTDDPQKLGTRFGMVATVVGFATLAGPPTAGALIDRANGDYLYANIWGGFVIAAGSLVVALARYMKTGKNWKVKV